MANRGREHDYVCALRAVTSVDGMTADFYPFDMAFLGRVAARIVNEVKGVHDDRLSTGLAGIIGVLAPQRSPLLGLVSVVAPVVATGNTCVVVASTDRPINPDPSSVANWRAATVGATKPGRCATIRLIRSVTLAAYCARSRLSGAVE